jgi:hypothetical protein
MNLKMHDYADRTTLAIHTDDCRTWPRLISLRRRRFDCVSCRRCTVCLSPTPTRGPVCMSFKVDGILFFLLSVDLRVLYEPPHYEWAPTS